MAWKRSAFSLSGRQMRMVQRREDIGLFEDLMHEPVRNDDASMPARRPTDDVKVISSDRRESARHSGESRGGVLKGGHPFHLGDPSFRIDLDDPVEASDVELFGCGFLAGTEEVRGLLRQADLGARPACHGVGQLPAGLAIGLPAVEEVRAIPRPSADAFPSAADAIFESTNCQSWICRREMRQHTKGGNTATSVESFAVFRGEARPGFLEVCVPCHQGAVIVGAEAVPVFHDKEVIHGLTKLCG